MNLVKITKSSNFKLQEVMIKNNYSFEPARTYENVATKVQHRRTYFSNSTSYNEIGFTRSDDVYNEETFTYKLYMFDEQEAAKLAVILEMNNILANIELVGK